MRFTIIASAFGSEKEYCCIKMNDLEGKLAVITGANSGIGLEAAVQLAQRGADVVLCCRSKDKAELARTDVITRGKSTAERVHVVQLDLADIDNIQTFRSRYDAVPQLAGRPVDMLILNAGIMAVNTRELTKQGIESQMGTNVVGHFKFTAVMIDLCKTAKHCRIVFVSSGAHRMVKTINFADFNRDTSYAKWHVYEESKLGNLVLMAKLNRLLEEKKINNVIAVGCHPGYTATNLQEDTIFKYLNYLFAQGVQVGATPTVLAATDPSASRNGYAGPSKFFELWGKAKWDCGLNDVIWNTELQDNLWAKCEELSKAGFASRV